jgi:hypothetical protein
MPDRSADRMTLPPGPESPATTAMWRSNALVAATEQIGAMTVKLNDRAHAQLTRG